MMTRLPFAIVALATALLGFAVCGCTPKHYALIYTSDSTLNVDQSTSSSRPVHVLVYMLKDDANFLEASAEDLWKGGNDKVKEDLVDDVIELDVQPGVETRIEVPLGDDGEIDEQEVQHIAVFAQFAKVPDGKRRYVILPTFEFHKAEFRFRENTIGYRFQGETEWRTE